MQHLKHCAAKKKNAHNAHQRLKYSKLFINKTRNNRGGSNPTSVLSSRCYCHTIRPDAGREVGTRPRRDTGFTVEPQHTTDCWRTTLRGAQPIEFPGHRPKSGAAD
ncbi:hypothetical protein FKM82_030319 [Ascaphus truei]